MNMFKKRILQLLSLIITLPIIANCNGPIEGDSFEQGKQRGHATLKIVYVPAAGFAYLDENSELTGVTINIMQEFADFVLYSQGIEINYEFISINDFSTFYNKVRDSRNGVFGLGNVTITESRKQELKFSPPYMTNIAVLITHADAPDLRELNSISVDFDGLTGLAFKGTLHEQRLRQLKSTYWQTMPLDFATANSEIIHRVSERVNYFSYIDIYNYWRAAESGLPLKQHPAADQASERFGIIMPLSNDWDEIIRDFFDQGQGFRTSRTYRAIMEKHLGTELTEKLERANMETNQF